MTTYISPDGKYPRYQGDIRLSNPNWDETKPLPSGWIAVEDVVMPDVPLDFALEESIPEEIDGAYKRRWILRPMTSEEKDRRDAPKKARQKLIDLGLTEAEVDALTRGLR